MNGKLLSSDFKKNRLSNVILFLFMMVSAAIAITVTLSLTQLFSSISNMYETAKPPHFLQMHKGEIRQDDIDRFNREYETVEHWQTAPMLNVYGSDMTVLKFSQSSFSLSDCRLDISLVKQNDGYDVLLDSSRQPLVVENGGIGVPVILLEQYDIAIGDTILLNVGENQIPFIVSSYVCDGQMNSTLCSSTRFLISDEDFERLSGIVGETEYLIEAWFTDSSEASAYQSAYEQSSLNLPKNGQAITYSMIFLLSAMSDLLMAVVFLLAGALLIVIALVCLRYVVLAEMEDAMREIGTMKAIGVPAKGIRGLYLGKIRILMGAGCMLGFVLAVFLSSLLAEHRNRTFGAQKMTVGSYLLALVVCGAVYGVILTFSKQLFRRLNRVSVTDLLVREKGFGKRSQARDGLRKTGYFSFNLHFGLHEVRKGYGLIFGLLLMVTLLMAVPARMSQTMESEEFAAYMGSPLCDLLLEVEQGDALEKRNHSAKKLLIEGLEQGMIADCFILRRVRLQAQSEGEVVGIHIDSGKEAGASLNYLEGKKPEKETEIALSALMAEELHKSVGEPLLLVTTTDRREFCVCGIYQDVTSGGRTAKAIAEFPEEQAEKYTYQVDFAEGIDIERQTAVWRSTLGNGYSVESMKEFVGQTLGGVTAQVNRATKAVFLIGSVLVILIVLLFLKLRIARNAGLLAIKRAIGIPFAAIRAQELYPVWIAGGLGILVGICLTESLGSTFISLLFALMNVGVSRISFARISIGQYLLIPGVLMVLLTVVTLAVCQSIKTVRYTEYLNE
ncbi:MAG: ABC transporter permease [Muribaculaceae bacterium]|nr:ABC transporter permease [Muribaculaceae bacterium]